MTQAQPQPGKRTNWIAISAAVLGGLVLLGAVGGAVTSVVATASQNRSADPQQYVESATGVTKLEVEASATTLVVRCDTSDVDEFALTTSVGAPVWHLTRTGDTLKLAPEQSWLNLLPFGGGSPFDRSALVTLSMPASACDGTRPLDAEFEVGAGEIEVDGEFGELDLSVGAGAAIVNGAAIDVTAEIAAGEGELNLRNVRTAELSVSAGEMTGRFTGTAPQHIDLEVAAGDATLWVPAERYAVNSEVAAGDFENGLATDPSATQHKIFVDVAAGSVVLQPGATE